MLFNFVLVWLYKYFDLIVTGVTYKDKTRVWRIKNTDKVIYAWNKKILSSSKNSKFCKQEIYKNDHIIDIHVNT